MALTIRDARRRLSELVDEVTDGDKEIQIGRRGDAEAAVIGTATLRRLKEELRDLRQRTGGAQNPPGEEGPRPPYAGLANALECGALEARSEPRKRRRMRDLATYSGIPLEEQARIGRTEAREPRFRRRRQTDRES